MSTLSHDIIGHIIFVCDISKQNHFQNIQLRQQLLAVPTARHPSTFQCIKGVFIAVI